MSHRPRLFFTLRNLPPDQQKDIDTQRIQGNYALFRYVAWVTLGFAVVLLLVTSPLVRQHPNRLPELLLASCLSLGLVSGIFLLLMHGGSDYLKRSNLHYLVFGAAIALDAFLFAIRDFSLFEDNAAFVLGTMVLGMVLSAPYLYSVMIVLLGLAVMTWGVGTFNPSLLTLDRFALWAVLGSIGALTTIVLETRRRRSYYNEVLLREANENLREVSFHDPLTGAYNRRFFDEVFEQQLGLAVRQKRPLTVMMLDLDRFKSINDTFGHGVGDEVLKDTVRVVQGALRSTDLLTRFGGEEFVILLPDTPLDTARLVADRLRLAREQRPVAGVDRPVTLSLGLVQLQDGDGAPSLLKRADDLLYQAKTGGRNRVCF